MEMPKNLLLPEYKKPAVTNTGHTATTIYPVCYEKKKASNLSIFISHRRAFSMLMDTQTLSRSSMNRVCSVGRKINHKFSFVGVWQVFRKCGGGFGIPLHTPRKPERGTLRSKMLLISGYPVEIGYCCVDIWLAVGEREGAWEDHVGTGVLCFRSGYSVGFERDRVFA